MIKLVTIKEATKSHEAILSPQSCRCQSCQLRGPFAWLAYAETAQGRQPIDWLCLHCLQLGYSPEEFINRVLLQRRDARFVLFPATSIETAYVVTPEATGLALAC